MNGPTGMFWKPDISIGSAGSLTAFVFSELQVAECKTEYDDHPWNADIVLLTGLANGIAALLRLGVRTLGSRVPRSVLTGLAILTLAASLGCQQELAPSDGSLVFGESVALDGHIAIAGDKGFDFGRGAAYVFTKSGTRWSERQKLFPNDGVSGQDFADSVSVDGDTVVVGSRREDDSGAAYVFVRNGPTWTLQQKLTAVDRIRSANFGESVSLDGDTAVVGAYSENPSGSAYVFVRDGTTWTLQQKLTEDTDFFAFFGVSVAVNGDTVLVGAPGADFLDIPSAVYVFVRDGTTWTLQQKLTPGDEPISNRFGTSVSMDGDTALVGASLDDDLGLDSGSAFVFVRNGTTWTLQQKLTGIDRVSGANFGESVSLDGGKAVVGAPVGGDGSAYLFVRNGTIWSLQAELTPYGQPSLARFGRSVSLDGHTALVGARYDSSDSFGGIVYAFDITLLTP